MSYSIKDLSFILYNNRSVNGVVKNFIPKLNPLILTKIELNLEKVKSKWGVDEKMVEVNLNEFDTEVDDIYVSREDINSLTKLFIKNVGRLSEKESLFLSNRGINSEIIQKWGIFGLSNISDKEILEIIGATCHPTLRKFLDDGIESGGIIIPLYKDGKLQNCAIRKINSHKSLKYSLSCPDVPVWGMDDIEDFEEEISICEGLFDLMALREMGKKAISCSSAMWSGLQLYQIIIKRPKSISIFSDNDEVGLKTSLILKQLFDMYHINTNVFVSESAKDASEHYFELGLNIESFKLIDVDMIDIKKDDSFNFIEYLKNRTY